MNVEAIEQHVSDQKSGQLDLRLKQFGWSCDFADRTTNGGCFPSCYKYRKKTVDWLQDPQYGQRDEEICVLCGNWELNCITKEKLSFPAPKNYPKGHYLIALWNPRWTERWDQCGLCDNYSSDPFCFL
jgi:hypothetical protein